MPKTVISDQTAATPPSKPVPPPFLLTARQGEAARALLSYVAALPLASVDAQFLAVVVAIRAARSGVGNVTGTDLRSLRLEDPHGAVAGLAALGWQVSETLVDGNPDTPVGIKVPELSRETDHPLPLGKGTRSRVSGWAMRARIAKPVKKAGPATRLAALFLAAHSSSELVGRIPAHLPEACRAALPELVAKGFLAELSGDAYRLDPAMRHLAGMFRTAEEIAELAEQEEAQRAARAAVAVAEPEEITPDQWAEWKSGVSPALLRHVEAVEQCPVCRFSFGRVAQAFMSTPSAVPAPRSVVSDYDTWRAAHPDCGREAATFAVEFRAEHGHGPSYSQLCKGLRWKKLSRSLRGLVVSRILADGWLTDTSPVPWTLRPGKAAHAQGIALPGQVARSAR
ncbi:hypothetical protein AB0N93_24865 [Streptomyces sp. NPDC091267]|uniref:hypothetical protein n=1 Tax=unclassified Streptomyces TaxID=2593676 RepID=UPI0034246B38